MADASGTKPETGAACPMAAEPGEQHHWLRRLVGAWTFEGEGAPGPDQPAFRMSGTETVRGLDGGLWVVAEGNTALPEGGGMATLMVLGYDPAAGAYVGSFACSAMTHLWVYRGRMEEAGSRLVLATQGPSMEEGAGLTDFEDVITIEDADHRTLASHMRTAEGLWRPVFTARYRRLPA